MTESLAPILIVLVVLGFVFRKTCWWHIPRKNYIKSHLTSKSEKELEFRFQEAVRVNVLKSMMVSFFVAFTFLLIVTVGKPMYQLQAISYYTDFIRDKEVYKNSSDEEKNKLMDEFFGVNDISNINRSNQDDMEAVTVVLVFALGIFSYVGILRRSRLTAIYEVLDERKKIE